MAEPALKLFEPILRASAKEGLPAFLAEIEATFGGYAREKKGFLAQLIDYVLTGSGKRVRPSLVFMASRFGQADPAAVKETAVAVEMIHIATLIHDDLVDEAVMRRKRPTVGVKFGDGAAVLLGDYVYAQAFQRLATLNQPELLRLFADTTMVMCEGEIGQYEGRYRFDLSDAQYVEFLRKKTASLMAAACRAGARLGALPESMALALETFGDRIGIAFQIVDDILDIEGDEAVVGKTLHTDLIHGKMTLPLILYSAGLPGENERQAFYETLRDPQAAKIDALIQDIRRADILPRCRARVDALVDEALSALAALPESPTKSFLVDVARRLSHRQS